MARLAGKIAIVTGADQDIGGACAALLAAEAATVIAAGRDGSALAAIDGAARAVAHSPAQETSWERLIDAALSDHGQLDILVNAGQSFLAKPLVDTTLEELRALEDANLVEPWLGLKHGIAAMRRSGGGSIVTVSSILAKEGRAGAAAACAAAGGVRIMTQAAALECGTRSDGIRVNTVLTAPPGDRTGADPGDVARAVLHVVSDEASFMTGSDLVVAGGQGA